MPNALPNLPADYVQRVHLSIKNSRTMLVLNLVGILLLIFFGWFFTAIALWLNPSAAGQIFSFTISGLQTLVTIAGLILLVFATLILHEAVHGLGFRLLAGVRPVFAFRGTHAYAAAPGWFIRRNPYLAIGLAPFIVLSLLAIGLLAVVPLPVIPYLILAAVMNASGSVGDLWVAVLLLRQPKNALAADAGDEITIYAPAG